MTDVTGNFLFYILLLLKSKAINTFLNNFMISMEDYMKKFIFTKCSKYILDDTSHVDYA